MDTKPLNPFISFCLKPIVTLEAMLTFCPKFILVLLSLGGACFFVVPQIGRVLQGSLFSVFLKGILSIIFVSLFFFYGFPWLLYRFGKWFSGIGKLSEIRTGFLWSLWPLTLMFILGIILYIITLGNRFNFGFGILGLIALMWSLSVNITYLKVLHEISWTVAHTVFFSSLIVVGFVAVILGMILYSL